MENIVCIGDFICLYCEESNGYVFSLESSNYQNGLLTYSNQSRDNPDFIPNPQAVVFKICTWNRYKLEKDYKKLLSTTNGDDDEAEIQAKVAQAKISADVETLENKSEQKRQRGRQLRYGQVIQLRHMMTGKYVHVSTTHTSSRDKNYMKVGLEDRNAKHAQLRILPRYKVKSEGDLVQVKDQIVLESVKSPGQFFHTSSPFVADGDTCCEVNLGGAKAGFTLLTFYHGADSKTKHFLQGGSVVQLFHKELEAYLVAEGEFYTGATEKAHLRVRAHDNTKPKTLVPPTSAITYWQIELEGSTLDGSVVHWGQQLRLRHMTTRLYLAVKRNGDIELMNKRDPSTVFRLQPVVKETDEVKSDGFSRIKHVVTGRWLHGLKGEGYNRGKVSNDDSDDEEAMSWDDTKLVKMNAIKECMYDDAFTIHKVEKKDARLLNYIAGMMPLVKTLVKDAAAGKIVRLKEARIAQESLREIKAFMIVNGEPSNNRQKILRNLKMVDQLVTFLTHSQKLMGHSKVMRALSLDVYQVLQTYLQGKSRKNELYFAKHISFFETQFSTPGEAGLRATEMITALVRDNRKIIDTIKKTAIDQFVDLVKKTKNYRYLDLLGVLCVCDGLTLPENQTYITQKWLCEDKSGVFWTELGQKIGQEANRVYISSDGRSFRALQSFIQECDDNGNEEEYLFLERQLDLLSKLCAGRNEFAINMITKELDILTWEKALMCLKDEELPEALRAKYCHLIIGMFIDIGRNRSVLELLNLSFIYNDLDKPGFKPSSTILDIFPMLRDWIAVFLEKNKVMTASEIGQNMLIEQVLRLLRHLVKFGFYVDRNDIEQLLPPLLSLLDGRNDKPFQHTSNEEKDGEVEELFKHYSESGRFVPSPQTKAIVDAKFQVMEILELLMNMQFKERIKNYVKLFKTTEVNPDDALFMLTQPGFNPLTDPSIREEALNELNKIDSVSFFDTQELSVIFLDLAGYKYDKMVTKSMRLLTKVYSVKMDLFAKSVRALGLITPASIQTYHYVEENLPALTQLTHTQISDDQAISTCQIIDSFAKLCHMQDEPDERHPINQAMMMNFDILYVIRSILRRHGLEISVKARTDGVRRMLESILVLLRNLLRGNKHAQIAAYAQLDSLLDVKGVESHLANALIQIFSGNQNTCLKITPRQIGRMVNLVAEHGEEAPEFINLLVAIVKIDKLNLPLKRNQSYVMKYVMQNYHTIASVLDQPKEDREMILINKGGKNRLSYIISLVDLFATCAEGENRFIESLCQTIFNVDDIMDVMTNKSIDNNLKRPYLRFLLWGYLNAGGGIIEAGIDDLPSKTIKFFKDLTVQANLLRRFVENNEDRTAKLLKKPPSKIMVDDKPEGQAYGTLHYFFDAVLPFIDVFFKKDFSFEDLPEFQNVTTDLASALVALANTVSIVISNSAQMKMLSRAVASILSFANLPPEVMETFIEAHGTGELKTDLNPVQQTYWEYYAEEIDLNRRLNIFTTNYHRGYEGANTVQQQLGHPSDRVYAEAGGEEELPLGLEFQKLVHCFVNVKAQGPERYRDAGKLIQQLCISSKMKARDSSDPEQVDLDVRCFQILRALIHNQERKLPVNGSNGKKKLHYMMHINMVQDALNGFQAIQKIISMMTRTDEQISKEFLAFFSLMLYDANSNSQKALTDYFYGTREERFFFAVKEKMNLSMAAMKERRLLKAHLEMQKKEAETHVANLKATLTAKRHRGDKKEKKRKKKAKAPAYKAKVSHQRHGKSKGEYVQMTTLSKKSGMLLANQKEEGIENPAFVLDDDDDISEIVNSREDSNVKLLLRVMACMCDGQYKELQDYLRHQPDNFKSANLVAETTTLLNLLYSHIDPNSIDLIIQLFTTLNEFAAGNPANMNMIYDNNIVEHVNFILRANNYPGCSIMQMIELKSTIGKLLMTMLEENRLDTNAVVKGIQDKLDIEAIQKIALSCRPEDMDEKLTLGSFNKAVRSHQTFNLLAKTYARKYTQKREYLEECITNLGFSYYFIMMRLNDLGSPIPAVTDHEQKTCDYYFNNSKSIEIISADELQKLRFRVKDKNALRDEVKEQLKWNVDRTSPSDKIRGLTEWSKDIILDKKYQSKMAKYLLPAFLIRHWILWNYICFFLSLVINVFMLTTWEAEGWLGTVDIPWDAEELPPEVLDPHPVVSDWFYYAFWPFAIAHNVFSGLLFVSYLFTSRPRAPDPSKWLRSLFKKTSENETTKKSQLRVDLISFHTLYYLIFLLFSILGTALYGYFFAFHLLNIIYNNQLLQRVTQAITLNGRSLIWVAILGVIIIYIFALASFAFLRGAMDPESDEAQLYCANLGQCTVTLLRYGLIGDLFEKMAMHQAVQNFTTFGLLSLFHITFFIIITTIGLNIVFGIILDTFSELRSLKWLAEQDMKNVCFICGKGSYVFETQAQGFNAHVNHEHNMWAYIYFFIYLHETKVNDFTNLEYYVYELISNDQTDFFPLDRAMCLTRDETDETESKLDDIVRKVDALLKQQRLEEMRKKRRTERQLQDAWEQRHRQAEESVFIDERL